MRALGFDNVRCGADGPAAWAVAQEWEARWQLARSGKTPSTRKVYPKNSVGDGFERFRQLNEWQRKPVRTREDWDRGYKYIEPVFGDVSPRLITFEHLDRWYTRLTKLHGVGEAGRAMKTWRALYNVLAAMKLCESKADPSLAIRKSSVAGRTEVWREGEVIRMVKAAWREGYWGLACIIAISWDTSFAPVDARTLTPANAVSVGTEWGFSINRGKTGEAAFGILSPRTRRMVQAYLNGLPYTLHDDAPIFRTKGYAPGTKGGKPQISVPYQKNSLSEDFRIVRASVFGHSEKRRLMDMRRTGAVEANAGGASVESLAAKMGNSIDDNRTLQRTYMPVNLAAVRSADEARKIGRKKLALEQNGPVKLKLTGERS